MRGLEFQDIFTMARIISKVDLNKEIEALVKKQEAGEKLDTESVGVSFVMTVIGKASTKEVEKEIYAFLGDVFEIPAEELKHMKPQQVIDMFKGTDAAEWKDFFTSVVRFVRQQN